MKELFRNEALGAVAYVTPGANAALSPEIALERLCAAAPYRFVLGQLETPMTTIAAVFAEAGRSGATTILDPAPVQPLPAGYCGVVLKLGQPGCYATTGNLRAAVPASEVIAADTIASGHTFNAVFANAAAALSVARAEVESLLTTRSAIACSR
jgi:sugar/nucleoside kinase (ribokinase family)